MIRSFNRAALGSGGLLCLLLAGFGALPAQASPHHFQEWFSGQLVSESAAAHELTVSDPATTTEKHFKWDKRTTVFHLGQKKPSRLDAKAVANWKSGTPLRVLYQKQGDTLLVRRIVESKAP